MKRRLIGSVFVAVALLVVPRSAARAEWLPPFELEKAISLSGLIVRAKITGAAKIEVLEVLRGKLDEKTLSVPQLAYDGPAKRNFPCNEPEGVLFFLGGVEPGLTIRTPGVVLFSNDGSKVFLLTTNELKGGAYSYIHQPELGTKEAFLKKLAEMITAEAAARANVRAQAIAKLEVAGPNLAGKGGLDFYAAALAVARCTLPGDADGVDALCRWKDSSAFTALQEINDTEAPAKLLASWGKDVLYYPYVLDYLARDLGLNLLDVLLAARDEPRALGDYKLHAARFGGAMHGLMVLLNRPDLSAEAREKIVKTILEYVKDEDARACLFSNCAWRVPDRRILAAMKDCLASIPNDKRNSNYVSLRKNYEYGIKIAEERLARIEKGFERLARADPEHLADDPKVLMGKTEDEIRADWGKPNQAYTDWWQYGAPAGWSVSLGFKSGRVSEVTVNLYGRMRL